MQQEVRYQEERSDQLLRGETLENCLIGVIYTTRSSSCVFLGGFQSFIQMESNAEQIHGG